MLSGAFLIVLFGYFQIGDADHWALIVAGSNGYYNYRHQVYT